MHNPVRKQKLGYTEANQQLRGGARIWTWWPFPLGFIPASHYRMEPTAKGGRDLGPIWQKCPLLEAFWQKEECPTGECGFHSLRCTQRWSLGWEDKGGTPKPTLAHHICQGWKAGRVTFKQKRQKKLKGQNVPQEPESFLKKKKRSMLGHILAMDSLTLICKAFGIGRPGLQLWNK